MFTKIHLCIYLNIICQLNLSNVHMCTRPVLQQPNHASQCAIINLAREASFSLFPFPAPNGAPAGLGLKWKRRDWIFRRVPRPPAPPTNGGSIHYITCTEQRFAIACRLVGWRLMLVSFPRSQGPPAGLGSKLKQWMGARSLSLIHI